MGIKIGFWENLILFVATALANYFPMRLGTILRMRYLKKIHGVRYAEFTGLIGVRLFLFVISAGVIGCIGMVGLKISGADINMALLSIFLSMGVLPFCIFLLPELKIESLSKRFVTAWRDIWAGFEVFQSNPQLLFINIFLVFIQYMLIAVRLFITFDSIQIEPSIWMLLIIAPATTLITFISLTPGNLGLREWVLGLLSLAVGLNFQNGIFAGSIDRAVLLACTFVFGSLSLLFILLKMNNANSTRSEL